MICVARPSFGGTSQSLGRWAWSVICLSVYVPIHSGTFTVSAINLVALACRDTEAWRDVMKSPC